MLKVKKFVTTRSRFEFETPISTATIKGTIVGFNVSEEKTVIKVCEGNVIVSSEGLKSTVVLKENQMALIGKGQKGISIEKLVENKKDQSNKERDSNKVNSTGVFEK
jgi:hypothetical protein